MNQDNYPTYMESGVPIAYIFASTRVEREYYRSRLNHLVDKWRNLINFVVMDSWECLGHAQELGLETFPGFVIHNTPTKENFIFDTKKNMSVEEVDKFVDAYVDEMKNRLAKKPSPVHNEL